MGKHNHDWSNQPKDNRMRYEKAGTMHFQSGGEAYAAGWELIWGKKKMATSDDTSEGVEYSGTSTQTEQPDSSLPRSALED